MKKTLRSLLALLVAVLMLFSFVPAAFAEDETTPQVVSTWDDETEKNVDVTKSYDGSIVVEDANDAALRVRAEGEAAATVDVAGDVVGKTEKGYTDGLYASADSGGTTEVHVGGDVITESQDYPYALNVWTNGSGTVTVTVDGGVTATAEEDAYAIVADAMGDDASIEVNVGKDVSAVADDENAYGVSVSNIGKNDVTVNVGGDVSASVAESGYAVGVSAEAYAGTVDVNVDGSVTAEAAENGTSCAINATAYREGSVSVAVIGDVTGAAVDETAQSTGVYMDAGEGGYYLMAVSEEDKEDEEESGDATANATVSVLINGTLSGDGAAVILGEGVDEEAVENGNVKLTVWQVALGEDQESIVSRMNWGFDEETGEFFAELAQDEVTEALEKAIQYIIKVQEATGATTTLEGTQNEGDYDVALEGDTVALKVAVNNGYQLNGVYNGLGERMLLVKDANGNYSLIVPKCGGVYFSLDLALTMKLVAEAALKTADGVPVYFNFYENGFYELICGSIYDRGTYAVEDGALKLTTRKGDEVPVAADGTLTYIFRDGSKVAMTLPAETLAKLLG